MAKKKMEKKIEESTVQITVLEGNKGQMVFDFNELPEDIKTKFGPFGLSHKLGDSAAGKNGTEDKD